jgi:hypothetical protein
MGEGECQRLECLVNISNEYRGPETESGERTTIGKVIYNGPASGRKRMADTDREYEVARGHETVRGQEMYTEWKHAQYCPLSKHPQ